MQHDIKRKTQDGVNNNMQNTKVLIKEILNRLQLLRIEISKQTEEVSKKLSKYDMLCDLTPEEETEADELFALQEDLENQLDSIDSAFISLSHLTH